jgi:hypothetical protein
MEVLEGVLKDIDADPIELDYRYSIPLDVLRWSEYPEVHNACKFFIEEFGFRLSKEKIHLRMVVMNLYYAYCLDRLLFVGYSRNRNSYGEGKRYNKLFIKPDNLLKVVDVLEENGYLISKTGFKDRRTGIGFQSRMRATEKLIELIEKTFLITPEMIGRLPEELIELRNGDKDSIGYDDDDDTIRMRGVLERYNKLLEETYIDVHFTEEDYSNDLVVNLSNKTVKRIFNKSSFELGGRYYGGWWQNIPSELRRYIVIGEHPAVEIDYSGQHIYLLYALKGINFTDLHKEPYIVPKDNDPDGKRPFLKLILLCAINCKSERGCITAVENQIEDNPEDFPKVLPDVKKLYHEFKEYHSDIQEYFDSGIGLKLQKMDSDIAEEVIDIMTRENMPVLVVHDSFVCRNIDADFLTEVMKKVYLKHIGKYFFEELSKLELFNSNNIYLSDIMMKLTTNKAYPNSEDDILAETLDKLDRQHIKRFWYYINTKETNTNKIIRIKRERILYTPQKELTDIMIKEELDILYPEI